MAYTFQHGDRPLEGYTVQRAVGRGGFGEVYYAISDGGREVALKYLRDNPQIELRGVSHCINLKSPHLVTIFDVRKNADGDYFILMEYVSGPSLRDLLIAEPNGLGVQKAAFFIRELAKGLGYLHDRGIVHRDLKPGNIFYDDGYVKIGDYGLSKFISISRHSAQTASVGTVHYMAPEVGSGNYSRGIDIYALGVILYEMLLGKVPFDGSSMGEVLMKHLTAQPEVDELPEPFGRVIRKALAKDPNQRYQAVHEMVGELFDVEDVRDSLAGFNPTSLTQAAARGARDVAASPVPSPNPPLPATAGAAPDRSPGVRLDRLDAVADRVSAKARRIAEKVARKMNALDRKAGRIRPSAPPLPAHEYDKTRPLFLSLLVVLGTAVVAGVIIGLTVRPSEIGIAAFLLMIGMSGGLALSRRAVRWLGPQAQPEWVQRLVTAGCSGPLMLPGVGVAFGVSYDDDFGVAALAGLGASLLFVCWRSRFEAGAQGELKPGQAFSAGLLAFVVAAVFTGGNSGAAWLPAIVVAATSLAVQAASWFWSAPRPATSAGTWRRPRRRFRHRHPQPIGTPADEPVPAPPLRWTVARAFWSVVAFCLFGGMVVTFLVPILISPCTDDTYAAIVGCIACFSFLLFAVQKTTQRRRRGFWRETLRPFLTAVTMTGMGAAITGLSMYPYGDDELVGVITGLVVASMLLLVLLVSAARPSSPRPVTSVTPPVAGPPADRQATEPDSARGAEESAAAPEADRSPFAP